MAAFSSVASQSSLLWSLQACYLKIELWKRILAMRLQTKLNKFQSAGGLVEEQDWNQTIKSVLNFYVTWESAIRISSEMEAGSSKANSVIFWKNMTKEAIAKDPPPPRLGQSPKFLRNTWAAPVSVKW